MNPILATDAYKLDHRRQYPEGTEYVYSNLTARGSRIPGVNYTVFFGLQGFAQEFLIESMTDEFFDIPRRKVLDEYRRRVDNLLGPNDIGVDHIDALHQLGYLPIRIKAVPEGTRVPLRVPMMTIENTHPDFFWVTNYLETALSAGLWLPITSATQADRMRGMLNRAAALSGGDVSFVPFQAHDFSMRGMSSLQSAAVSGAGHLLSFTGTDTLPAIEYLEKYYAGGRTFVGGSVPATEHSVMSAGGQLDEMATFERLLETYPTGIVSVVSDTWDLWNVITQILPKLKDKIMARDGKLVIRPDSGDPADILCGSQSGAASITERAGVIELLWNVFGGSYNDGYKILDPHIGAIYGDSITYDRAEDIVTRLARKGFASTNVVLGVGSYTYQYVTRDTFNMAMKATWARVNGEGRNLFKNPVTDDGTKKSATGRLAVLRNAQGGLYLVDDASPEKEQESVLEEVFANGMQTKFQTLDDIRERLSAR